MSPPRNEENPSQVLESLKSFVYMLPRTRTSHSNLFLTREGIWEAATVPLDVTKYFLLLWSKLVVVSEEVEQLIFSDR